jgi:hypothetical protein
LPYNPGTDSVPRLKRYVHHIIALANYLALTLIMTFPLATEFTTAIPGDGFDGWQNYWNLWWVKKALLDLGTNPFFCDYVYYPTGASLYFHTLNIFNGLFTMPIQAIFGLTVAYNFVVVFSFVAGGYGIYLLVYRFGAGKLAAFVAGLVFTFSPYHFAHLLGHMQLISLEWLPFYVLFTVKALDRSQTAPAGFAIQRPDGGLQIRREQKRDLLSLKRMRCWLARSWPAAVFLVLTFLCEWGYYVMYLAIFTLLYTGYVTWKERRVWEPVARAGLIWLLFIVLASPILVPMAIEAMNTTEYLTPSFEQSLSLSADLLAFFTPNEMHPLWGDWARAWSERFTTTTSERMVFAGYIPLALGVLALWKHRQRAGFWALSLLVFFILALGPVLHVGGQPVSVLGTTIPLPYIVLYRLLPFVRLSRSISRFDVMVMLSLGVLAGLGAGWLSGWVARWLDGRRGGRLGGWVVGGVAGALICFEFLAVPYPMTEVEVPSFYQQVAQEPGDFVLMELPMNWDRPIHMFNQVYHGKKLIAAYFGKPNPLSIVEKTPVLQHFRYLGPDIIAQDISEIGTSVLASFNVRYVILDLYQMPGGREREVTLHLTEKVFGDTVPFYRDERLIVYRVEKPVAARPFLSLGQNWGRRQMEAERPIRQVGQGAVVHVRACGPDSVRLRIVAQSPVADCRSATSGDTGQCQLDVYSGSQRLASFELEAAPQEFVTPPLSLTEGDNVFHLYYNGECKVGPIISELDLVS